MNGRLNGRLNGRAGAESAVGRVPKSPLSAAAAFGPARSEFPCGDASGPHERIAYPTGRLIGRLIGHLTPPPRRFLQGAPEPICLWSNPIQPAVYSNICLLAQNYSRGQASLPKALRATS